MVLFKGIFFYKNLFERKKYWKDFDLHDISVNQTFPCFSRKSVGNFNLSKIRADPNRKVTLNQLSVFQPQKLWNYVKKNLLALQHHVRWTMKKEKSTEIQ